MPVLWLLVIGLMLLHIPRIHPYIKLSKQMNLYFDSLLCAILYTVVFYIAALLLYNVGKTPYDITPRGIWLNFLTVVIPFIGFELIRGYVVCTFNKRKLHNAFLLIVAFVATLLSVNITELTALKNLEDTTIYLAQDILPELFKNFMLTYLVFYGGATASIIFGGFLLVFQWFCPVLPQLNWLADGVLGILIPTLELFYIITKYGTTYRTKLQEAKDKKNTVSWVITLFASVAFLWFIVGVFPVYPSVIATGSMEPLIKPGDVVLIEKFYTMEDVSTLKKGDIIAFKRDNIMITHRILDILHDKKKGLCFRTKGDNNSAEDARIVLSQELRGRYIAVIPKVGYPTLWMKSKTLQHRNDKEVVN